MSKDLRVEMFLTLVGITKDTNFEGFHAEYNGVSIDIRNYRGQIESIKKIVTVTIALGGKSVSSFSKFTSNDNSEILEAIRDLLYGRKAILSGGRA